MIDAREKEHDMEEVRDAIARTIEYHHGNEPISSSPMQEAAEKRDREGARADTGDREAVVS